jgi:hypothetical protein
MSSLSMQIMFVISAILIMAGVFINAKFILNKYQNTTVFTKFLVKTMKYLGFAILAYLVYECPSDKLILNLSIFVATYFVSLMLYLLARRVSIM